MHVIKRPDPATHSNGYKYLVGCTLHDIQQAVALVEAGNDVHEHQFIGALLVIVQRECVRVSNHTKPLQMNPFDEIGPFDVEPRNYAYTSQASLTSEYDRYAKIH